MGSPLPGAARPGIRRPGTYQETEAGSKRQPGSLSLRRLDSRRPRALATSGVDELRTARVRLRRSGPADEEAMTEINRDPEVGRFLNRPVDETSVAACFGQTESTLAPTMCVHMGELIRQGQVIGLLGNSGNSDAPHLHFAIVDGPGPLSSDGLPFELRLPTGCGRERMSARWRAIGCSSMDRASSSAPITACART